MAIGDVHPAAASAADQRPLTLSAQLRSVREVATALDELTIREVRVRPLREGVDTSRIKSDHPVQNPEGSGVAESASA